MPALDISLIIGLIGAISGIVGSITGILSLRKVSQLKSQDLRMRYKSLVRSLWIDMQEVSERGEKANESRINRLAAQGKFNSGEKIKWEEFFSHTKDRVTTLDQCYLDISRHPPTSAQLEDHVLQLEDVQSQINKIIASYKETVAEDDRARDKIFSIAHKAKI